MATLGELSCRSALAVRSGREEERGKGGDGERLQVKERAKDGLKYNVRECDGRDDAAHTAHSTDGARADTHKGGETGDNGRRNRQAALSTQSTTAATVQLVSCNQVALEFSLRAGNVRTTTSADRSLAHLRSEAYVVPNLITCSPLVLHCARSATSRPARQKLKACATKPTPNCLVPHRLAIVQANLVITSRQWTQFSFPTRFRRSEAILSPLIVSVIESLVVVMANLALQT
jgi:hypothetical protein